MSEWTRTEWWLVVRTMDRRRVAELYARHEARARERAEELKAQGIDCDVMQVTGHRRIAE